MPDDDDLDDAAWFLAMGPPLSGVLLLAIVLLTVAIILIER